MILSETEPQVSHCARGNGRGCGDSAVKSKWAAKELSGRGCCVSEKVQNPKSGFWTFDLLIGGERAGSHILQHGEIPVFHGDPFLQEPFVEKSRPLQNPLPLGFFVYRQQEL